MWWSNTHEYLISVIWKVLDMKQWKQHFIYSHSSWWFIYWVLPHIMHIFLENESVPAIAQNSLFCSFSSFLCTLCYCNHFFFSVLYVPFTIIKSGKWWSRWLLLRRVAFISQKHKSSSCKCQATGVSTYSVFFIYILSCDRFFSIISRIVLLVFITVLDFVAVLYTGKKHEENNFTRSFQESKEIKSMPPGSWAMVPATWGTFPP